MLQYAGFQDKEALPLDKATCMIFCSNKKLKTGELGKGNPDFVTEFSIR